MVSAEGEQLGVMPTQQALETARSQELDLVEVAPEAQPPVCRIMDFGKFKYTQARRQKSYTKATHSPAASSDGSRSGTPASAATGTALRAASG